MSPEQDLINTLYERDQEIKDNRLVISKAHEKIAVLRKQLADCQKELSKLKDGKTHN